MDNSLKNVTDSVMRCVSLYCVYDRVASRTVCTFQAENDGLAVRDNAPSLAKVCPIGDLELYRVGKIDVASRNIILDPSWCLVSWDSYKFPENPFVAKKA